VNARDGTPRVTWPRPTGNLRLTAIEWSADGELVLQISRRKGPPATTSEEFATVSVDSGAMQVFKTIQQPPNAQPIAWILSADRTSVTFGRSSDVGRDIFSVAIRSGEEVPLVHHVADDVPLAWMPDGERLLFVSDRGGSAALWSLEISDDNPSALPSLVRTITGNPISASMTRAGVLYLAAYRPSTTDVYISKTDSAKSSSSAVHNGDAAVSTAKSKNRFAECF
jgi:hypothetical protein